MFSLRQFSRSLLITALLLSLAPLTFGQSNLRWRPLAPINGGAVLALLSTDGRVYAGTRYRGVFISTDNGTTWRQASNGLGDIAVYALVAAGNNVLAATADGIYRTTNGGLNWTLAAASGQAVRSLLVSGASLFAGTATGSVLRSTNEGQTWSARGSIVGQARVQALISFEGELYAGTDRGVFYSANEGQSWISSAAGLPINGLPAGGAPNVQALTISEGQLFAGIISVFDPGGGVPQIYNSRDGRNWEAVGENINTPLIPPLNTAPANITGFLADESGLHAVSDIGVFIFNGQQWSDFHSNGNLPIVFGGISVMIRSNGRLLLGGEGGVYTLASNGQNWIPSRTGLTAAQITALAVRGNTILASAGASGLFRSQDDGQSWTPINVSAAPRPFVATVFAVKGNTIFAGSFFNLTTFRSDNDGQSWTQIGGIEFGGGLIVGMTASEQDVYVNSSGAVYRLNPEGNAWELPPNAPFGGRVGVAGLAASGANVYGTTVRGIRRSTARGSNFVTLDLTTPIINTSAIAARGSNVYLGVDTSTGSTIFVSTNNGDSFMPTQANFRTGRFTFSGDTIYAAAQADGVQFSNDNGFNWTAANAGLAGRVVTQVAVKGETLLAGTINDGIYATISAAPTALASVSAASFRANAELAPESIVAAFGTGLATATQSASAQPLPTLLAGTRVVVRDSAGVEREAPLFFVSPTQINYQIPLSTAAGNATVTATSGNGSLSLGNVTISAVAPGLFAANASGQGLAAAVVLRIKGDGTQTFEPVVEFNATTGQFVARPIDLGAATDQVFLLLYGTGIRQRSSLATATALIGGTSASVTFAGAQGDFAGLDQVNLLLPRSLAGRGEVEIALTVDSKAANPVRVVVR